MGMQSLIHYATPPGDYFWRWSSDGDAAEWADGRTTSLWMELQPLLAFLAEDGGLPPLGSVMLLLAACRDDWSTAASELDRWLLELHGGERRTDTSERVLSGLLAALGVVRGLPKELRGSLKAKCLLVSAVFENSPQRLAADVSAEVVEQLTGLGPRAMIGQTPDLRGSARFLRDVKGLLSGLADFDEKSLESRLRTGLEDTDLQQAELDFTPSQPQGDLLAELAAREGEAGAVAAVAKQAIAMIHFPGRLDQASELPVGGISDITNRGPLDRLLPAELAWDDLVLAARLVHHEALFFRREVPPQELPRRHRVFLDRGVRMWGMPRVLSLGVALGLRRHPEWLDAEVEVAVATADGFENVGLESADEVARLLSELVPSAGILPALENWWRVGAGEACSDVVVVSVPQHLKTDGCRMLLTEMAATLATSGGRLWVVAVDRRGGVVVESWGAGGNRTMFTGEFGLSDLFAKPGKLPVPEREREPEPVRNALAEAYPIYREKRLPFLFPVVPRVPGVEVEAGYVSVSEDHRLMLWREPGGAAEELLPSVPGSTWWLGRDGESIYLVASFGAGDPPRVYRVFADELREVEIERPAHSFPRGVGIGHGAVVFGYGDGCEAFSLRDGRRFEPSLEGTIGTYVRLSFDGECVRPVARVACAFDDMQNWPYQERPQRFEPEGVRLAGGSLCVSVAGQWLRFIPGLVTWAAEPADSSTVVLFQKAPFDAPPGVELKVARPAKSVEVLHDSRGMLHVRVGEARGWSWSLLTYRPDAIAAWDPTEGLVSRNNRLLRPGEKPASGSKCRVLAAFLKNLASEVPG